MKDAYINKVVEEFDQINIQINSQTKYVVEEQESIIDLIFQLEDF